MLPLFFWIIMLIWVAFGAWSAYPGGPKAYGGSLLLFLLLVVIGIRLFPISLR